VSALGQSHLILSVLLSRDCSRADMSSSLSFSCSKSSLLSGLLGEMKRKRGEVSISGSVGYCGQTAWIQNSNVSVSSSTFTAGILLMIVR
jgi:hypothetical protein